MDKPFKMKPKTRKAENALWRASDLLIVHKDEVMWERVGSMEGEAHRFMAVAVGDKEWNTIRWVQTQNDPDWEINRG